MSELLTAAQMRAIETAAIESGEVAGLELMERAGRGVVAAVFEEWPELARAPHKAVVLCGPGNNGGDGFVVARLLKDWGWAVKVFLYGDPEKLPPDAKVNCDRWGAETAVVNDFAKVDWHEAFSGACLIVDAVFGTGLKRPFPKAGSLWSALTDAVRGDGSTSRSRVVAIDNPSRLCADSGQVLDEGDVSPSTPTAHLTVAFHRMKTGLFLKFGPRSTLRTACTDIGLDRWCQSFPGDAVRLVDGVPAAQLRKATQAHKYGHGHALILSGGAGRTGAARLAARGALRIGAGLVTLGVPPAAQQEVACQITALMLRQVADAAGLAKLLEDARLNALCLGPGLGVDRAHELVPAVCAGLPPRATVLDADALTAFEDDPRRLFGMLHDKCVLTPHAGEFGRLFPDIAGKLNETPARGPAYSKVDAAREAAARAGCVVLFKGPATVIAAPDGRCSVSSTQYERAAPGLATAGSGDVLAGFITGLLARGLGPMQAAEAAAWLHVECACRFGPGLIAEDLPEELPGVFRDLGL